MTSYLGSSIVTTGSRTYRVTREASKLKLVLLGWSTPRCSICGQFSGKKHTKFCKKHLIEDNRRRSTQRYKNNKK